MWVIYAVQDVPCALRPGLGWVDFDFYVPPYCPTAQPLLPNSHQRKQSLADSETLEIQVNKTGPVCEHIGRAVLIVSKRLPEQYMRRTLEILRSRNLWHRKFPNSLIKVATDTKILDLRTRYRTKLGWFFWFCQIQRYDTTKRKWQILYLRTRYRTKLDWFFWFDAIHETICGNLAG